MKKKPYRLNISQLSERSGISYSQIDLLIQDGVVSMPVDGYMFTAKHEAELEDVKAFKDCGFNVDCTKRSDYMLDWFVVA